MQARLSARNRAWTGPAACGVARRGKTRNALSRTLLVGLVLLVAACGDRSAPAQPPAPTASATFWVEEALVGAARSCAADEDCASGVCRFESCVGALAADQLWIQELVARRLADRVAATPGLGATVVATVRDVVAREAEGPVVRARAAFVLSFLPGAEATGALVAALDDPSDRVRRRAALGLVGRGDARGLDVALAEIHGPDAQRRAEAARSLGAIRDERAVDALTGALEDESRNVRRNALMALGRSGDPRALQPLERARDEGPATERYVAVQAIATLRAVIGSETAGAGTVTPAPPGPAASADSR